MKTNAKLILAAAVMGCAAIWALAIPGLHEFWGGNWTETWTARDGSSKQIEETHVKNVMEQRSWCQLTLSWPWQGYGPPLPSYVTDQFEYLQWGPAQLQRIGYLKNWYANGTSTTDDYTWDEVGPDPNIKLFRGLQRGGDEDFDYSIDGRFNYGVNNNVPSTYKAVLFTKWASNPYMAMHITSNVFLLSPGAYSMVEPKPQAAPLHFGYCIWPAHSLVKQP